VRFDAATPAGRAEFSPRFAPAAFRTARSPINIRPRFAGPFPTTPGLDSGRRWEMAGNAIEN